MRLTGLMAVAAILSMLAAPALAQQARNPAAKLSLTDRGMRAGAPMKKSNKAISSTVLIIGGVMTAAVIGAVVSANSDSHPASA